MKVFLRSGAALTVALNVATSGTGNANTALPTRSGNAVASRAFVTSRLNRRVPPATYQTLYSFVGYRAGYSAVPDGSIPVAGLLNEGGTLYGTTEYSGAFDAGAVFEILPSGQEHVIHSFAGGSDGANPQSALIDVGGTMYGTTAAGGGITEVGTVFKITPSGQESPIYAFTGAADGGYPLAPLLDVGGTMYGTTFLGGASQHGTVFAVTPSGQETVLYGFKGGTDGAYPEAGLLQVGNTLYGTTLQGGGTGCARKEGCGTVFAITTAGVETVLHRFGGGKDGAYPGTGSLLAVGNTLYGTTSGGGANGLGTVFAIATTGTESVLYSFKGSSDGADPDAGLIEAGGTLYGTTIQGGASNAGTIFDITTSGQESVLYSFAGSKDGEHPYAGLLSVGNALFGTTAGGGAAGDGTIFSLTP